MELGLDTIKQDPGETVGPALSPCVGFNTAVPGPRLPFFTPATERVIEGIFHFPGSCLLHCLALRPVPTAPSCPSSPHLACAGPLPAPSPQVPDCCPGFFGTLCEPCPGGKGGVCSGHGQCQDRLLGSGECRCHEGFHGTACEMCELGRYGPNCAGGEPRGGQRTEAQRQPSQVRVEALGNSCPPLSRPQSVTVPMACAKRGFKGTAAVSVMWAGKAPAVTRVSSLKGERRVTPGEVVPRSKRPEPSSCPHPSQRSLALNARRSATPMPSE